MKWSLRRRCELHNAVRGERRAAVGPSLCPSGALSGDEGLEVLGGNLVVKAGYRHYVEPYVMLFEGFPEVAMFWAPLDQEFFHPSRATAMTDASWFSARHYLLNGRFIPGGIVTPEGFNGCGPPTFGACLSAGGPCSSFGGEVQKNASAVCADDNRMGCSPLI